MESQNTAYSDRLLEVSQNPRHRGAIFQMEADEKGLALVDAKIQSLKIYLMVDPDSETILEARFFTYGGPVFTSLAEILCRKITNQKMDVLHEISSQMLEAELRDQPDQPALPATTPELSAVDQILDLLEDSYPEKKNIALAAREARSKAHYRQHTAEGRSEADQEWQALDDQAKMQAIEKCLDEKVRAALQMDGGGLEVLELENGTKLKVRYQGACSSCGSSIGGTLIFIEQQLRENVYYNLSVEPETPDWFPGGGY